jgi:hypothetical protein
VETDLQHKQASRLVCVGTGQRNLFFAPTARQFLDACFRKYVNPDLCLNPGGPSLCSCLPPSVPPSHSHECAPTMTDYLAVSSGLPIYRACAHVIWLLSIGHDSMLDVHSCIPTCFKGRRQTDDLLGLLPRDEEPLGAVAEVLVLDGLGQI